MTDDNTEVRFINSMAHIDREQWNSLLNSNYPFIRHEFLYALETSGSAVLEQGWQPCHALVYIKNKLQGCMPLYIKGHPYGEYVFDHIWEHAFKQHGLSYYPKLLTAIPFTPVRGPRYLVGAKAERDRVVDLLFGAARQLIQDRGLSSWHILFPDTETMEEMCARKLSVRNGVNFFWHNDGYKTFDDFLVACNARKRKNIRKERAQVAQHGISFRLAKGDALSKADWQFFYRCYQMTYAKRSGHGGYLSQDFFEYIAEHFSEHVLIVIAEKQQEPIAAALNFLSKDTLYGRYWGCVSPHVDKLHFETCYYQQIEYCIANNIQHFDGGVQGEHKIQRGFVPTTTYSCHWIEHPQFRKAINRFVTEESEYMAQYKNDAGAHLPFKKE